MIKCKRFLHTTLMPLCCHPRGICCRVAAMITRLWLTIPWVTTTVFSMHFLRSVRPEWAVRWLLTDKFETFRYAPKVKAPTLIIAAAQDEVIPPASTQMLATRFAPGVARTVTIHGVGHNTISEDASYPALLGGEHETR